MSLKKVIKLPNEMAEGWGLAKGVLDNQIRFFATDGTNRIFVIDPLSWEIDYTLEVE